MCLLNWSFHSRLKWEPWLCLMTRLFACQPQPWYSSFSYQCHLGGPFSLCPVAAGGQFRPEMSAPLCQRGISSDVQEADKAGEGQRGHEGGAGQVQVAVRGRQRLAHRRGGEEILYVDIFHIVINEPISTDTVEVSEQGCETREWRRILILGSYWDLWCSPQKFINLNHDFCVFPQHAALHFITFAWELQKWCHLAITEHNSLWSISTLCTHIKPKW